MGNRLTKIFTRTGDAGNTGLGDGSRVAKDSPRIQALGDVDELNSCLGVLLCEVLPDNTRQELLRVQHDLFDLGGELCIPGFKNVSEAQVKRLEELLEQYNVNDYAASVKVFAVKQVRCDQEKGRGGIRTHE